MALPDFSIASACWKCVHCGAPIAPLESKMADFHLGARNNIHIIDSAQNVRCCIARLKRSETTSQEAAAFCSSDTKRQAQQDGRRELRSVTKAPQYVSNSRCSAHAHQLEDGVRLYQPPAAARRGARSGEAKQYTQKETADVQA